jgi:hypothetical protein
MLLMFHKLRCEKAHQWLWEWYETRMRNQMSRMEVTNKPPDAPCSGGMIEKGKTNSRVISFPQLQVAVEEASRKVKQAANGDKKMPAQ